MVKPFLKWPGGKRWLAPIIAPIIAQWLRGTYFEPFLGGGAVYFRLLPQSAVLSDINSELIDTYLAVQKNAYAIVEKLKRMAVSERHYYDVRTTIAKGYINRAARVLYLNRTAFGGIYRLNRLGRFNVPYGGGDRRPDLLWENGILTGASAALRVPQIICSDFESVVDRAGEGDVVYCDPTYTVTHNSNCFVRYNERNFAWADQERLAAAAARATQRGVVVLVSNAHHASIRKLYPTAEVRTLTRPSCVCPARAKRRRISECLFVLRPRGLRPVLDLLELATKVG